MSISFTDVNLDKAMDQFDILNVTATVEALRAGLTTGVVTIPLPQGSGHRFIEGSLSLNGVALLAPTGTLGNVATVRLPSPVAPTSIIRVQIVLGDHFPPARSKVPLALTGLYSATDTNGSVSAGLASNALEFSQRLADLNVNLRVSQRPLLGAVAFQADITNPGPDTATASVVVFQLPSIVNTVVPLVLPVGCAANLLIVTCTLGDIAPNATVTTVVGFSLAPTAVIGSQVGVVVTATTATFDTNTANNQSSASFFLDKADLSVEFVGLIGPAVAGELLPFKIQIANAGPTDAFGAVVDVELPLTPRPIVPIGPTGSVCTFLPATRMVHCTGVDVPSGQNRQISMSNDRVAFDTDITKTLDFSATVSPLTSGSDPNPLNNSVKKSVVVVGHTGLSVAFVTVPDSVVAGQKVSFTLAAANAGPSVSGDVDILVTLDQPVVGLAAVVAGRPCRVISSNEVVCSTSLLDSVSTPVFVVVSGTSLSGANYAVINATAKVSSASPSVLDLAPFEDNTASSSVAVRGVADVRTSVSGPSSALAGQSAVFTVDISNDGPSDASGVLVSLTVSDAIERVVLSDDAGTSAVCRDVVAGATVCGPFALRSGGVRTLTLNASTSPDAAVGASVSVRASATSTTFDPENANNASSFAVPSGVSLSSLLSVSVSSNPSGTITAGVPVSYEIVVTNSGKTRTDGATVQVRPPSGYSGGAPSGCTDGGVRFWICQTGPIAAKASARITSSGTASAALLDGETFIMTVLAVDSTDKSEHVVDTSSRIVVNAAVTVEAQMDETVVAGNSFSTHYIVRNAGPSNAVNVMLVVDLDSGARLDGVDRCITNRGTLRCALGPLNAGATATIDLRFTSQSTLDDRSTMTFRHTLSWNEVPAVTDLRKITVLARADLNISWKAPDKVIAGQTAATTMMLVNLGPSLSRNLQVDFTFSEVVGPIQVVPSLPAMTCVAPKKQSRIISCRIASLPAGATVSVGLDVSVLADAPDPSLLEGSLELAAATTDPAEPNNHASLAVPISAEANLVVSIVAPDEVKSSAVTPITISVVNNGPSVAQDARVDVLVPPKLASLFASGVGLDCQRDGATDWLRCKVGLLKTGARVSLQLQAVFSNDAITGSEQPFRVSAFSKTTDPYRGNDLDRTSVSRLVGRATGRRDVGDPAAFKRMGNTVVLNGEVKNPLDVSVGRVFFTQDIPVGQRLVAATATQGHCDISLAGMVMCFLGDIAAHKSVAIQVTTVVNAVSTDVPIVTMAAYSSDDSDDPFERTASGSFVRPRVKPTPALEITSTSPQLVRPVVTANAPLFSGLGLSALFGLGLVGWVRRGRREDPLLQLA